MSSDRVSEKRSSYSFLLPKSEDHPCRVSLDIYETFLRYSFLNKVGKVRK